MDKRDFKVGDKVKIGNMQGIYNGSYASTFRNQKGTVTRIIFDSDWPIQVEFEDKKYSWFSSDELTKRDLRGKQLVFGFMKGE